MIPSRGPHAEFEYQSIFTHAAMSHIEKPSEGLDPPPPAIFFPPFSSDGSSDTDDMSTSYGDDELESSEVTSRRADIHQSDGYPDGVDLTSGDEDGEDPENEPDTEGMYVGPAKVSPVDLMERRRQSSLEATGRTDPSSAATVGGPGSVGSDDDMSS